MGVSKADVEGRIVRLAHQECSALRRRRRSELEVGNFVGQLLLIAAGAQASGIEADAQHLSTLY